MKTASAKELRRAVHKAVAGGLVFPAAAAKTVSGLLQENGGRVCGTGVGGPNGNLTRRERILTGRELQVLNLIARGLRNREIGNAMGIASKTVEAHIRHIRMKLDTRSRTQGNGHGAQQWVATRVMGLTACDACFSSLKFKV